MLIQPRTLGFICTTAHPDGCAANVAEQIRITQAQGRRNDGPKRVLVIGASTGYGLAARISAAFGFGAATLGVFLEKPPRERKSGSAGWYNSAAFHQQARAAGLPCLSIQGDAFAEATRDCAIEQIRNGLGGPVDLVVYSLAAPARRMPDGEVVRTVLKPIGAPFTGTTINTDRDTLTDVTLEPATEEEIAATTQVMGGADWAAWMHALAEADLLAPDARTLAFSYLGPDLTWPIYRHGTIGRAKEHLEASARELNQTIGRPDFARVALLKSIVTQASAAIPVVPLYLSVALRVMKDMGLHEGAIEQQNRLFREHLYPRMQAPALDQAGRLRLDDLEMRDDVQAACKALWSRLDQGNFTDLSDYAGYKHDFLNLFGFLRPDIDYSAEVDPLRELDCIQP